MSFGGPRASGILLHPTSLPGPDGIGDLGPAAFRFLDFLEAAGQSLWQVLPLGPTGYGDSPYACFSSFAGNPLLVSLESLVGLGLLAASDLEEPPVFPSDRVAYDRVIAWKLPLLSQAARRFLAGAGSPARGRFDAFCAAERWWLDDYCLFMALKQVFDGRARAAGRKGGAWNDSWDRDIALREPAAMLRWKEALAEEIVVQQVIQFLFFEQWDAVRREAAARGIRIIGDLPIFAAPDSADVWANRECPPDYFAATGQLWGNPLYDWAEMERQNFRFWIARMRAAERLFDFTRIDHFRGFDACWTVPAGEPTAELGRWVDSPGVKLFESLERELGPLPLIAEDLGVITPGVHALRERFGLPGMRILQFAFDAGEAGTLGPDNRFLPHNHSPDSVVYTGTHDNDTTRGWYAGRTDAERRYIDSYAPPGDPEMEWRFIRMAFASVCRFAVVPLQDALGLGPEARMNTPGTTGGNWAWRFTGGALNRKTAERLRGLAELYGRSRRP
ncbi:MAG: 4-alpha-glucanotransferase [Spirochaetes bacterium]|nr:4-alpha-glucanotransferase [Spirochaetota bacterium]